MARAEVAEVAEVAEMADVEEDEQPSCVAGARTPPRAAPEAISIS